MRLTDAVVVILCLSLSVSTGTVSADGSVGCLFSESLCNANAEWCFDDYAFGRCLPRYENERDLDLYQYDLKDGSLLLLKQELEKLISLGYRWSHFYTQCVLKALLYAFRYQDEYDESSCRDYTEDDEKPALAFPDENEFPGDLNAKDFGGIQFSPRLTDTSDLNDIYLPTYENEGIIFPYNYDPESNENYNNIQRALLANVINKNKRSRNVNPIPFGETLDDKITSNYLAYLNELANEEASNYSPDYIDLLRKFHFTDKYNTPDHFRAAGSEFKDDNNNNRNGDDSFLESLFENRRNLLKTFSKTYNTPEKFRTGHETKDEVFYPKLSPVMYVNEPSGYFTPEERRLAYDNYNSFEDEGNTKTLTNDDGVYTEGGVVYSRDENQGESSNMSPLNELIRSYNGAFKRPERLDVKKPGPSFSINNFAFKKEKNRKGDVDGTKATDKTPKPKAEDKVMVQPEKKKVGSPLESPALRRQTTTTAPLKEKIVEDTDGGSGYITFKNRINTWQEGARIIKRIEDVLGLAPNTFSFVKVGQNEIRFKIDSSVQNVNASDIVRGIENNKDVIQRATGWEIVSSGVTDKNKAPTSMSLLGTDERQLWILSFLLCGVIAAVAIAFAALFVIKRHSHTRDKLQNLSQLDSEASKDYQDLCRARMATKTAQDKPEGNTPGHRVSNLTKESEGSNHSPSSRSSTSSWSEEPVLTNMDISTGHMVLSYMEDHLKNKDRLEQEWIALCAYEAEPCATTIAVKEENSKKNRYSDVLPYDHARVILNELSNMKGSDYINASTITDHDPRNPAYIATQGPLPNTAADFWQMVWEQGSVVMVMLTRLTENGIAMCHRYWPEEGSELYHIYEVHLVSEHIWCDDYLVRSFYLKNLKTGETRTVTQFHFLSWPENGIPLSTKALLEFRRKVNKSYRGRSCPIVVHCSDGVGRTGTYCLIDMVLNRMAKGAKEIDIAATLEHIRDQRPLMVRTKQQFEFVLISVAEEVHAILKALPANPNHSPPPVLKEKE